MAGKRRLGVLLLVLGLIMVIWGGVNTLVRRASPTPVVERLVPTARPGGVVNPTLSPFASGRGTSTPVRFPSPSSSREERTGKAVTPDSTPVSPPASLPNGLYTPRERFCVGVAIPPPDAYPDFDRLQLGWYLDWGVQLHPSRPGGVEYAQMVRVREGRISPDVPTIQEIARENPGSLWLVGNEPDVIWQDKATPQEYAEAYYLAYYAIKEADPTARIAIGGVSQPTPLRIRYIEAILEAYRERYGEEMPVDVWNIHNFILREERDSWGVDIPPGLPDDRGILYEIDDSGNLEAFKAQIWAFRRWMKERGFQGKPLIVSEYGIPMPADYGFPFERVRDFMYATFDFFLTAADPELGYPPDGYRLVQRWCWFSLGDLNYPTGNLFDPETKRITPLGEAFVEYIEGLGNKTTSP